MTNKRKTYDIIVFIIVFVMFIAVICSCKVVYPVEQFIYNDNQIHHISIYSDTTLLNWSDLKVLQIDSLQYQYLELNIER